MRAAPRPYDADWRQRYKKPELLLRARVAMNNDMRDQRREQTAHERLFFGVQTLDELMLLENLNNAYKLIYPVDSLLDLVGAPHPLWLLVSKP